MQEAIAIRAESSIVPNTPEMKPTVVLVEDEEMIRGLLTEVLKRTGYEVLSCAYPEEGIAVCQQYPGRIDLLLTDVVMPGMSGPELVEALRSLRPNLKVLYVSGYTDDSVVRHGVLSEQVNFLQKPFSPVALAHKVRQVLDSR